MFWRVRRSRTRKNTARQWDHPIGHITTLFRPIFSPCIVPTSCRELRRRLPAQTAVRPMMIIIHSPSIHNILRLRPAKEQLAVEAFVAQFAIEALDVAILPRTARRNESRFYTTRPQPLFHGFAHELRPEFCRKFSNKYIAELQLLRNWSIKMDPLFQRIPFLYD